MDFCDKKLWGLDKIWGFGVKLRAFLVQIC